MIHLPRGVPVRQNVNPARINLPEAMGKLRGGSFSGYLSFQSQLGSGVILFQSGRLISAFFIDREENRRLIAYDAIARIFHISILGHASLNIYRMSDDLVLYLHALLHGRYLHKQKPLQEIDVRALLDDIRQNELSVCIRVFSQDKTALVFYEEGFALGFFHEGAQDLQATADLSASVAALPGAILDVLEIQSTDQLVLADLMGSADLHPIWQRTRKNLLEEQNKREQSAMRSSQEAQQRQRQQVQNLMKTVAGTYLGKFGVTQVEKAFAVVGPTVQKAEIEQFYLELQRLARLVASQAKINEMVLEMRARMKTNEVSEVSS